MTRIEEIELAIPYINKFNARELTESEFKKAIGLKFFRLSCFYFIKDKDGEKVQFSPNIAQLEYYKGSHQNDIILKARQLGFTTFKMLHDLDTCLFRKNFSAGCIAHNEKDAKDIYRNKIRYAYQNIKPQILKMLERLGYKFPLPVNDKDNGYVFSNGSSIGVSTGYRGGTLQSLHISEFGKICKKYPEKAQEIVTGAFNSVGKNCTKTIESTAEGKQGYFYDYCQKAKKLSDLGKTPVSLQFKFHFFPWWRDPQYSIDESVDIPDRLNNYFDLLESKEGIELTVEQKKWYTLIEADQGDDMKREYPSTPQEAFEQAIEGAYYAKQFRQIYKDGRICDGFGNDAKVNTAWDIGVGDSTCIWFYQKIGNEIHLIDYYENSGEGLEHYAKVLHDKGYDYDRHYAPHDIDNRDFSGKGRTRREMAKDGFDINGKRYRLIFDKVAKLSIEDGINYARKMLDRCLFDADKCERGIQCLENYRKEWNDKLGCWRDKPLHDWASDGSDAFRYLAVVEEGSRKPLTKGFKVSR